MTRFLETRKGFTLTEVLMAMFVMAIGMLSLLALFPVAFHNAKWALDTEQVARGAANAQSTSELPRVRVDGNGLVSNTAMSVRNDSNYGPYASNNSMLWKQLALHGVIDVGNNVTPDLATRLGRNTFLCSYEQATNTYRWTFNTNTSLAPPGSVVRFPPVFVDPLVAEVFYHTFTSLTPPSPPYAQPTEIRIPFHVGADAFTGGLPTARAPFRFNNGLPNVDSRRSIGIPRMTLSQYRIDPDPSGIRKSLELMMSDELTFGPNGQPVDGENRNYPNPLANPHGRQSRFSWGFMCHWPDYSNSEICEVSAVVFNSRPVLTGLSTFPPGEVTYSNPAGTFMFTKGLTQAQIVLPTPQPIGAKVGDWILDSTFILPEFNPATPAITAPFLDKYIPAPINGLLPGLVGGHFYKILDISAVQGTGPYFQTITIDRPAKSDGFTATLLSGVADVITKGAGKMPQR